MSVIVLSEYKALCLVDYSNAFSFISFPSVFYIYIFYTYILKRQELKLCFKHRGNTVMQNWAI